MLFSYAAKRRDPTKLATPAVGGLQDVSQPVEILMNGIVTVLIESTEQARLRLGLARNTVIRYLNHERPVYSPGFKG